MPSWNINFDLHIDSLSPELIRLIAQSQALAAVIRDIPITPFIQRKIDKLNILRAVKGTTGIEGANLTLKEVETLIYPVGFYKTKARHLKQLPITLEKEFNNKIPETIEQLIQLPGVGRKTANLVRSIAFRKPAICVDVHVHRICNRLGYLKTKNPYETEMALRKKLPKKYWERINVLFVAFGQTICKPVSPFCSKCPVKQYCNQVGIKKSR